MTKAIILEKIGEISYRDIRPGDVYQPTREEEILHGTRVVTRQTGTPGPDEIEVEALLGAVCTHETSLFLGDLTHPRYPMVPGHEAVHRVLQVGRNVKHIREGDYASCCWYMGQWSKKVIGPAATAYRLPDDIGDPSNWVIEPAASIVNAASYMEIKPGGRVLLIGAGFMGLLMTQLVSRYPLHEFVAVDVKPFSVDMAKKCGAYETILSTSDAGKARLEELGTGHFDTVVECSGTQAGLDMAVDMCGMAGYIYLFGWHRKQRTIDFKLGHLRGQHILHTSPAMDDGKSYERYWETTIRLFERGVFDLSRLITNKYKAAEIKRCFADSTAREDGFIKSVFYFD